MINQHMYNPVLFDSPKKIKQQRERDKRMLLLSGSFLLSVLVFKVVYGDVIAATIERYNVFRLFTFILVERQGECNVFVNGFSEKMVVCPDYIERSEDE